jgi:hypothetical protein
MLFILFYNYCYYFKVIDEPPITASSAIISIVTSSAFKKVPVKLFVLMYNSMEVCCVISLGAALSIKAVAPELVPVTFLEFNSSKLKLA